ncbi:MAG: 50S ribosomal protein L21 [Candidatus Portnoybacteria bacterium CG06_land_8_20_14_3_00_39_12]|uniref:Large ribosomal subunit protein bL21 n=1 Tax=Candidatus Portnoybacteria bacterium CG06_land_8_20_14_3_00_39_12 TaxID=1974809 RepID=A0A2M7AX84_9BACT|nr:MAG: 50S ribosomal protein L21 [Parcubacteria group bacterium CG1_02_40_25]PIU75232.1 MAG: 50S ribosomal protein L21 [Candidatus Portnoybacteria bacterium CG06_land_8_20_14_3_00_39_12]
MPKIAVIKTGGKQYKVSAGQKLKIEKIPGKAGDGVSFLEVLLVSDDTKTQIGQPLVTGAKVAAKIVSQGRAKKVVTIHYKSKTRRKTKKGHRQSYTEIEVVKV